MLVKYFNRLDSIIGVPVLLLNVYATESPGTLQTIDLTPLHRFTRLSELWVKGYNEQRFDIGFDDVTNVTALHIKHLHLDMKQRLVTGSVKTYEFVRRLKYLQTLDVRNMFNPAWDELGVFLSASANDLEIVSLRRIQALFQNPNADTKLNITTVFPEPLSHSVRYLDLSYNDFTAVRGSFLHSFRNLKFLDLSHNFLVDESTSTAFLYSLLLFHPQIQVLNVENQFQYGMYMYMANSPLNTTDVNRFNATKFQ